VTETRNEIPTDTRPAATTQAASRTTKILRTLGGVALVALGTALLVLPGPGVVLLLAGLGILANDHPRAARLRDHLRDRTGTAGRRAAPVLRTVLAAAAALLLATVLLATVLLTTAIVLAIVALLT